MDPGEIIISECPSRPDLVNEIVNAMNEGETRILFVGAAGSGKTRLARSILKLIDENFTEVSASVGYGPHERASISELTSYMQKDVVLLEELSDFSMNRTPRDKRLTKAIISLIKFPRIIIATTRNQAEVDPALINIFKKVFYLKPPSFKGRKALFESISPEDTQYSLINQYRSITDEEKKSYLLRQFAGLQPAELLASKPLIIENSYSGIAGCDEIMKKMEFLVLKPLTEPMIFKDMGVLPPRGVLLVGPSGVGKTLIARSIGRASRVSFFDIQAIEVVAAEVGESERRLHAVFERARAAAPSLILFDDIDSIAPRRSFGMGLSEAADRLLTTLLVETDGLAGRDDGVIVMATTSRLDALDPAITRPGRFDYIIDVPLPDAPGRGAIFDLYAAGIPMEDREGARRAVVAATAQRTGADIEGIVREAAVTALREDIESRAITREALEAALKPYRKKVTKAPAKKRVFNK